MPHSATPTFPFRSPVCGHLIVSLVGLVFLPAKKPAKPLATTRQHGSVSEFGCFFSPPVSLSPCRCSSLRSLACRMTFPPFLFCLSPPPTPPGEPLALCGGIGLSSQSVLSKRTPAACSFGVYLWARVIARSRVLRLTCVCVPALTVGRSRRVAIIATYYELYNRKSIQYSSMKLMSEARISISSQLSKKWHHCPVKKPGLLLFGI